MESPERLIPLSGAFNFRDLGGYEGLDGRTTSWGRLFRSDTLHELTESDVQVLRSLGLATVVDLRMAAELERTGRGPLASEPIGYRHLSVIRDGDGEAMAAPAPAGGKELPERYLWGPQLGREALVEALAGVSNRPVCPWSSTVRRARTAPGCWRPWCSTSWGWPAT